MPDSRYQRNVAYVYSFTDYETTHKLGDPVNFDLRRMEELMHLLGNPHLKAKSIHIAGTKGKGSVAAMIASVMNAFGYKTGLYTSPHLIDIKERFQIDGKMITEAEFVSIVDELKPAVSEVNRKATYGRLTTFEVMTALCFIFFARQKVDFQVIEVGLGGRLDATNVINPEVCVITPINLDHTDVLGDTIARIASEKAGIIKEGVTVVSSPQVDEALEVIEKICLERNARLIKVGVDVRWQDMGVNSEKVQLEVKGRLSEYKLSIPLLGCCQMENAATAAAALEVLVEKKYSISAASIIEGMGKVNWPGRFQVLRKDPLIIVDGAHNALSARELKKSFLYYYKDYFDMIFCKNPSVKSVLIFGASSDKDIVSIIDELAPLFNEIIVTRSKHPRSKEVSLLVSEFKNSGIEVRTSESVAKALELAISQALNTDLICITGSLFVVGDAIDYLAVN
ncbi:MAG: bifunctional folylpolyglutamate synthase/dihydrofolate synthase [Dehalococcoidales bacterium]|nr:bifunctional folylpolyglutamate synthase/dihydrofolate synthase [Dehalococcoidales bacterium]